VGVCYELVTPQGLRANNFVSSTALALGGCATTVTGTPAGIEIATFGKTPQEVADEAEAHCQKYGLDAQLKDASRGLLSAHELFDCVKTNR